MQLNMPVLTIILVILFNTITIFAKAMSPVPLISHCSC